MALVLEKPIKVAVLGSGAREHALAWKIAQSPYCKEVIVIPGNAGIEASGIATAPVKEKTKEGFLEALEKEKIHFVVIGPDDFLEDGFTDFLEEKGYLVFGPSRAAAQLEWSKAFAKTIMTEAHIPTARFVEWKSLTEATEELEAVVHRFGGYPVVLKFDGLALGKGVVIAKDDFEAKAFLENVFDKKLFAKAAGRNTPRVVCEEFVLGHEVSVFAICDGEDCEILAAACDYKRLQTSNLGPNTGGMGAFSPVPWFQKENLAQTKEKIFKPVLAAMKARRTPFKGLLYAGLMVKGSDYFVLEFNARFGDPETQCVLPRVKSDVLVLLWAASQNELRSGLNQSPIEFREGYCVNVVMASSGYPGAPRLGHKIQGFLPGDFKKQLDKGQWTPFFSGVKFLDISKKTLETAGGRVLGVCAFDESLELARRASYEGIKKITFEGALFREDIGLLYE